MPHHDPRAAACTQLPDATAVALEAANDWQPYDPALPWQPWSEAMTHAVQVADDETVVVAIRHHDWRDTPGAEVTVIEVRDGLEINVEPVAMDLPTMRALHEALGRYLATRL